MTRSLYPETCVPNSIEKDSFHVGFLDFEHCEKIENLAFSQPRGWKRESKLFEVKRDFQQLVVLIFLSERSINSFGFILVLEIIADANEIGFTGEAQTEFNLFQLENCYQLSLVRVFFTQLNSG